MNARPYVDNYLTHNSALACFLLSDFCRQYQGIANTGAPLTKCLLVLPMLWHQESCTEIARRQSGTTLATVLSDASALRRRIRERIQAFAPATLQGINLAVASGLLQKSSAIDEVAFECAFTRWPRGSKPESAPAGMMQANQRLARWFAAEPAEILYPQFLGTDYAIHH